MGLGCRESVVSIDDGDGGFDGGCEKPFESVSCSICLDVVSDNGDRSLAKLQCGHQFHLDCIGSAFNMKGAMQCPNCRKIEKGQWLYANGCRSLPEFSVDDWAHDEDIYDLSYSEMSIGVHWCPFGSLAHLPSLFDEGEFSPNTYHDLQGQHTSFAEHTTMVSSAAHPCPYIAYFGPIPPSSSNSSGNGLEGLSLNNYWNATPVPSELPNHYAFPATDLHYHGWEHRSPPFSTSGSRIASGDQASVPPLMQRSARNSSDLPRSGSFLRPFIVGHRARSIVGSSMILPYQGSNARARDRVQPLQAYHQQQTRNPPAIWTPIISRTRRSSGHRGSSQAGTVTSSSDQTGFSFIPPGTSGRSFQEAENPLPLQFHGWNRDHAITLSSQVDRESSWSFHHVASGSHPAIISSSFRQRHGTERMPSQNRS